jgi:TolB-like protein/Flp pilus assembly protein TadD
MRQIRLALGDDANAPVTIETLPKQGYRLIAPVAAGTDHRSDGEPGEDAIRLQLHRILADEGFRRSERICRFLRYTVEQVLTGHGDEIKESVLAVEVYDRPADYNPKIDPIVRNDARRLRSKFREYYDAEGRNDPIIIEFPKGSYLPVFQARTSPLPESNAGDASFLRSLGGPRIAAIAAAALIVIVLSTIYVARRRVQIPFVGSSASIAVLPFTNLGPDPGNDYLSDGLTEDLINALANVDGLRVPARTSAFAFKGKQQDIREIGAKLNVEMVLEGSVRKEGDKLRVTAQLNNVSNGYHLWSATYDREFKDALHVEGEIAEAIATTLRLKFAEGPGGRTADPEAYNLFQQARFFYRQGLGAQRTQQKAIEYFNQAIAKDPGYGLAYAGLSDARFALYAFVNAAPEALVSAETAARKSVALDDSLSEAHDSLANVLAAKRDWVGADKEFQRALDLNPRSAKAHLDYAIVELALTDRLEQAIEESTRAISLDPIAADAYGFKAMLLVCARRYDEAIAQASKSLELDPRAMGPQNIVGRAYVQKGLLAQAAAEFQKAQEMSPRRAHWAASLAELYVKSGRRAEAEKMLTEWNQRPGGEFGHAESMAMINVGLGNKDEAFRWLEQAYRENWSRLAWIKISPEYDSLRADPRFPALLNRMGLN